MLNLLRCPVAREITAVHFTYCRVVHIVFDAMNCLSSSSSSLSLSLSLCLVVLGFLPHAHCIRWTKLTITGNTPPARSLAGLGYDELRNVLVLFGGSGSRDDTWELDLNTNAWTEVHTHTHRQGNFQPSNSHLVH